MSEMTQVFSGTVKSDWIDYNGHMGDFAYAIIFSDALTEFMSLIGIDERYRRSTHCTIYTLEIRIAYMKECHLNQPFRVFQQLIEVDKKRFHVFLRMEDGDTGEELAICEQVVMHMQQSTDLPPKSLQFPVHVQEKLRHYQELELGLPVPEWVGRPMGLRKKTQTQ